MKYKVYKKTTKHYEDVYNEKEKETKEIQLQINDVEIHFAEHQYGTQCEPMVHILTGHCCHTMSFERFVEKLTN